MSKTQHLKLLQKSWYDRLKQEGFNDIEQPDGNLKEWDSFYFKTHYEPDIFDIKHHYYYLATHFLNHLRLNPSSQITEIHLEIWLLHSDGLGSRQIASRIATRMDVILSKERYNKDNVAQIIKVLKRKFEVFRRSNNVD